MALKTFHIVQGPSRTPLLSFPRYLTTIFSKNIFAENGNLEKRTYENLKIPQPRFTNKCPVGWCWMCIIPCPTPLLDQCRGGQLAAKTRHLLVDLEKTRFSWKTWFFDPILQLGGFWQDRSVRKYGAQLYGPWSGSKELDFKKLGVLVNLMGVLGYSMSVPT